MDPDALLDQIRGLVGKLMGGQDTDEIDGFRLAYKVEALDKWMTQGGFRPCVWATRSES